jgi:hypothetical protein
MLVPVAALQAKRVLMKDILFVAVNGALHLPPDGRVEQKDLAMFYELQGLPAYQEENILSQNPLNEMVWEHRPNLCVCVNVPCLVFSQLALLSYFR